MRVEGQGVFRPASLFIGMVVICCCTLLSPPFFLSDEKRADYMSVLATGCTVAGVIVASRLRRSRCRFMGRRE